MSVKKRIISKNKFYEMKNAYNDSIKLKLGDTYSNFVSFPVQDIKDFIALIEKKAEKNNAELKNIQFHFVANTDKGQLSLALAPDFSDNKIEGSYMNFGDICPPICGQG